MLLEELVKGSLLVHEKNRRIAAFPVDDLKRYQRSATVVHKVRHGEILDASDSNRLWHCLDGRIACGFIAPLIKESDRVTYLLADGSAFSRRPTVSRQAFRFLFPDDTIRNGTA